MHRASLELKSRRNRGLVRPQLHCVPRLAQHRHVPPGAPVWLQGTQLTFRVEEPDDAQLTPATSKACSRLCRALESFSLAEVD